MSALASVRLWAETVKFSHSVFALPFALIATFLAGRHLDGRHRPHALQLVLIVVCMVGARSAAMTFNRLVDRDLDALNPRTQDRPLATRRLRPSTAYLFLLLTSFLFFGGCWAFWRLFENRWPLLLAVPVLLYLCAYSYSKRFTQWSHFWLGSAIGFAPLAAWLAIDPASMGWTAVLLGLTVTLWIGGFDILYACQDIDVDRRDGLFSLPSRAGARPALLLARGCHALVVVLLVTVGALESLGWLFFVGVVVAAILLFVENTLVRPDDFSRVNLAFFTVNGVMSLVVAACALGDILLVNPVP